MFSLTRWWWPPASWLLRSGSQKSPWELDPAASCYQWPNRSTWRRPPDRERSLHRMSQTQGQFLPLSPILEKQSIAQFVKVKVDIDDRISIPLTSEDPPVWCAALCWGSSSDWALSRWESRWGSGSLSHSLCAQSSCTRFYTERRSMIIKSNYPSIQLEPESLWKSHVKQ